MFTMLCSLSSCFYLSTHKNSSSSQSENKNISYVDFKQPTLTASFKKENMNVATLGYGFGYHYLPSFGNAKILVIPVESSDSSFESSYGKDWKITLQNAFFGDSSSTGWESVSSFYEKSSYNQLHISGEISPTIKFKDITTSEMSKQFNSYDKKGLNYTDDILFSCLETLDKANFDFSDFDSDGDNYIDAVWMVYSMDYQTTSSFLWAYTTWASSTTTFDSLYACCYSWASFNFLTTEDYRPSILNSYKEYSDAHTFIHETGHMLGLDDYYSYNNGNTDTPMGGVDMMDFNIGDHTSFSKYLLGWCEPTVLTEDYLEENNYKISLTSFTENGNFLLYPIYKDGQEKYNGTPFDEYLLIEYYTPTNLNESDTKGYGTSNLATYSVPGVLVYHIDARVGKIIATTSGNAWDGYCYDKLPTYGTDTNWGKSYTYTYIFNNTKNYSYVKNLEEDSNYYRGRLISILPKSGKKIQGSKTGYSNVNSLYRSGSSFGSNNYSDFIFDDGSSLHYSFTVKSATQTGCQLEFKTITL